ARRASTGRSVRRAIPASIRRWTTAGSACPIAATSSARTAEAALGRLRPEALGVDAVLPDFVVDDPLGAVEEPRRLRAVASRGLQRVLNQILFVGGDGVAERDARHRPGGFGRLQRGRQMMAVNHLAVAGQDGALERVLELAHVAGPVVAGEHVD